MARIKIPETDGSIVDTILNECHKYGVDYYSNMPGGIQLTHKQYDQLRVDKRSIMHLNPYKPFTFDGLSIFISNNHADKT